MYKCKYSCSILQMRTPVCNGRVTLTNWQYACMWHVS